MAGRWLCRHGWHSWQFVSMSEPREIGIGEPWGGFVCTLVQKCRRCGIKLTRYDAPTPKTVKVG